MSLAGELIAGAGDVEMRPGRVADEALEELRRGDRAAVAAAGVLHVGELGIDQLVVGRPERHAPDRLAGRGAGRVRRAASSSSLENSPACSWPSATMIAPVSVARSIMKRGLNFSRAYVQRVGEHQAPLGVGVDDLDRLAGHRGQDVARPDGAAARHVLDQADHADGVDLGLARARARASARRRRPRPPCRPSCPPCRRRA